MPSVLVKFFNLKISGEFDPRLVHSLLIMPKQSCKMSQIWQIYQKVWVKSLWEYKTGSFFGHTLTTTVAFFFKTAFKIQLFGIFALKFASYAHLIL